MARHFLDRRKGLLLPPRAMWSVGSTNIDPVVESFTIPVGHGSNVYEITEIDSIPIKNNFNHILVHYVGVTTTGAGTNTLAMQVSGSTSSWFDASPSYKTGERSHAISGPRVNAADHALKGNVPSWDGAFLISDVNSPVPHLIRSWTNISADLSPRWQDSIVDTIEDLDGFRLFQSGTPTIVFNGGVIVAQGYR